MRVLMLSNLYPPEVEGGAEILAGEIAGELTRQGHDIYVLAGSSADTAPSMGIPGNTEDTRVRRTLRLAGSARLERDRALWRQLNLPLRYYRRFHRPENALELQRAIHDIQPDVLYIWEITSLGVTSLLATLPTLGVPIVFHLGSYWLLYTYSPVTPQSRLRARWLKQWLIGATPGLTWTSMIAVSEAVKEVYARAGCDAERIEVIHNGIARRFFQPPSQHDAPSSDERSTSTRLLSVGRLCPEKGVMTTLQALALLRANPSGSTEMSYHLDIVGDGDAAYLRELRAFARDKALTNYVTFHGRVAQETLIDYYDRADILLNTALWQEPFGLTTVEAMARGLPVIATRVGGSAEIITPGVDGLLTAPGDAEALATAIRLLATDPDRRARLATCARRTAEDRFTIEENARRVARHLQRAAGSDLAAIAADGRAMPGIRRIVS